MGAQHGPSGSVQHTSITSFQWLSQVARVFSLDTPDVCRSRPVARAALHLYGSMGASCKLCVPLCEQDALYRTLGHVHST